MPEPELPGSFVGSFEVLCGALVRLGLFTRLAAIPLMVAIATTKADVLGCWSMMHGSRTDWSMVLGSIFLLIKGGGNWSADRAITQ